MLPPPPWLPFVEYVLIVLEHPPNMFVSKLAACCIMLFLTRSDPKLLRALCHKWAIRFSIERASLIACIRGGETMRSRALSLSSVDSVDDFLRVLKLGEPDACVEHFLRLVSTLVPMYFSWNWHRTEDVIRINKDCEVYIREKLLPMCIETSAEEAVADEEEKLSLLPLTVSSGRIAQLFSTVDQEQNTCSPTEGNGDVFTFSRLGFVTLGNLLSKMRQSKNGLVLIFHAKYSSKSCEVLSMFQNIVNKRLLSPEVTICIIHAVAEPELANMYKISWFPTIIYIPPLSEELFNKIRVELDGLEHSCEGNASQNILIKSDDSVDEVSSHRGNQSVLSRARSTPSLVDCPSLDGEGYQLSDATPSVSLAPSLTTCDEELLYIIKQKVHSVYPANGEMTISSLVQWINNKGLLSPRKSSKENPVSRICALREEEKFRDPLERVPAMTLLKKMQALSDEQYVIPVGESPVFIFLGGGMAAGKSTAATALSRSSWWGRHKANSVLVNADDFKLPVHSNLNSSVETHECSTRAAEKLMVEAVNHGRNIVFDSTMMWRPFVEQVVHMVRNAHHTLYEQGVGYMDDGVVEEYFKPIGPRPVPLARPYEIRLFAITVEPDVAVPRGILRLFSTGRGVPIPVQLRSFRLFAENFKKYVEMVDSAFLYNNNVFVDLEKGELPPVLAEKKEEGLVVYDEAAYALFLRQRYLNEEADNTLELYPASLR